MISESKVGPHRKVSNLYLVYTGRRHESSELKLVEIFMSGNKKGVFMYVASKRRSTVNIGLVLFEGGHLTKRILKTAEIFNTFFLPQSLITDWGTWCPEAEAQVWDNDFLFLETDTVRDQLDQLHVHSPWHLRHWPHSIDRGAGCYIRTPLDHLPKTLGAFGGPS